jgi:beta-lactamase regulating signal transducer with metallopeptidase domain
MNELSMRAGLWLLHTAVGGGVLLGVTCLLVRFTRQPARRQRLGEWGLTAALLVAALSLAGPSWLVIGWTEPAPVAAPAESEEAPAVAGANDERPEPPAVAPPPPAPADKPAPLPVEDVPRLALLAAPEARGGTPPPADVDWLGLGVAGAVLAFAAVALVLLVRLLLGYAILLRLLLRSEAAPVEVRGLFAGMAARLRRARLLVSRRLPLPLSCGLVRPTVVLPVGLCQPPAPRQLRWIFAHELTHLERRDAWSALLFGLGQVLFFYVPWFWWLKRQVRLCQEYVADAAAADAGAPVVDYAAFLVSLAKGPAVPTGATGVSGNASDLFRRVSMLLQDPLRVETRCPRRWSWLVAGALVSLGVLTGGLSLRAEAAQDGPVVIIIQPQADNPAPAAQPAPKQKIRVFMAPLSGRDLAQAGDDVLFWRFVEDKGKVLRSGKAGDDIVIELVGQPGKEWAYRLKQGDNLKPLQDALARLEKLYQGGQLSQEAIQREMARALEFMKAVPASPMYEKKELRFDDQAAPQGSKYLLVPRELELLQQKELIEALVRLHKEMPNASEEQLRKELFKLLHKKADPGTKYEFEFVPMQGGKDKAAPKKVDDLDQVRKLLEELEKLRADQKEVQRAEALARKQAQEALEALGREVKQKASPQTGRPRLGVTLEAVAPALADQLNLPRDNGLLVTEVMPGTPAAKIGLKVNDILLKIDGAAVPGDPEGFVKLIASLRSDAALDVVVLRKGQKLKLGPVRLDADDPAAKAQKAIDKAIVELWTDKVKPDTAKPAEDKKATTLTLYRMGEQHMVLWQGDGVLIVVRATVKDGKGKVNGIAIHEPGTDHKYASPAQVPEAWRGRVQQMIEALHANMTSDGRQP